MKKVTPFEIADMLSLVNERIGYVNNGACGIAAVAIYRQLKKYGFNPTIITMEDDRIGINHRTEYSNEFLPMLRSNRKSGTEPDRGAHAHYMVRLGSFAIDTRGAYKIEKKKKDDIEFIDYPPCHTELFVLGNISEDNLHYLNGINWAWCGDFKRSNRRHVESLIEKQLDKLFIA